MLAGRVAIQRDLGKLQKWAGGNLRTLSKGKRKVLHLGCSNPPQRHRLGTGWPERSCVGKDLVDNELDMSQKCALAATKTVLAGE